MRSLDIWRCAIVRKAAGAVQQADLTADNLVWLPPTRPCSFRADPFGLWDDGKLHIFVEYFDYRNREGAIELLVYDEQLTLLRTRIVMKPPWHLSYPLVFRADGEIWMLPEARRSGQLTLYRARAFPDDWEATTTIDIDRAAVDATPLFHNEKWWLFYGRGQRNGGDGMELNIAFADRLTGPWRPHPLNPVRRGANGTRPAGTPLVRDTGHIDLPVQNSERTYGGSVRRLAISQLDEQRFEAEVLDWLGPAPSLSPYIDGLHTLSVADGIALIDCKRIDRSVMGNLSWHRGRFIERLRRRHQH